MKNAEIGITVCGSNAKCSSGMAGVMCPEGVNLQEQMPADENSIKPGASEELFKNLQKLDCTILDKVQWWTAPEDVESPKFDKDRFTFTQHGKFYNGGEEFSWSVHDRPIHKVSH